MINATGQPQSLLLLGGTSDIALAIAEKYLAVAPLRVVLAARPSERLTAATQQLRRAGADVSTVEFDATDTDSHPTVIDEAFTAGDIDVAVVAFGVHADDEQAWQDHGTAVELARVNYTGAVSAGVALAARLKQQGHGAIAVLSSVAGERVRRSNFVYGSSKAGTDGFYLGLGEALRPYGAHVTVIRPGHVHTKLTAGRKAAPLARTAEQVADTAVSAIAERRELVWVPAVFRYVMSALRHVPRPLFRKLPL